MRAKIAFSGLMIASAGIYIFILYDMLFVWFGRSMVVMSEDLLANFNYANSINLIPFKTNLEYLSAIVDGTVRGHAIRNLSGNLFLFFPAGFFLPFFVRSMKKIRHYSLIMAAVIIVIEAVQLATRSGSMDIDDFMLNFAGAVMGFIVFTRTPVRALLGLRAW